MSGHSLPERIRIAANAIPPAVVAITWSATNGG